MVNCLIAFKSFIAFHCYDGIVVQEEAGSISGSHPGSLDGQVPLSFIPMCVPPPQPPPKRMRRRGQRHVHGNCFLILFATWQNKMIKGASEKRALQQAPAGM